MNVNDRRIKKRDASAGLILDLFMISARVFHFPVALILLLSSALAQSPVAAYKQGHSFHGESFDSGPRQKPWPMAGIGEAHFPITTNLPEVQKWFDQGNALLHSFWYYEAERAFRWCIKLEPDNAMAYWGMARAAEGSERSSEFIREAARRKDRVSERERLYIEALEASLLPDPLHDKDGERNFEEHYRHYKKVLETICIKYPDDMEAQSLLALANMGDSRYGTELIIRQILSRQPNHPGAHHYRIHNWDYHEAEQALESCRRYTELVPGIGHAQHMPGHIYSIVGMWHEAAISMDAATRVEKRYMKESLTFPFNNWNYAHNLNYLSYIQEQLGMPRAAMFGARQLIDAPLDPKRNGDETYSSHSVGIRALARVLLNTSAGTSCWIRRRSRGEICSSTRSIRPTSSRAPIWGKATCRKLERASRRIPHSRRSWRRTRIKRSITGFRGRN